MTVRFFATIVLIGALVSVGICAHRGEVVGALLGAVTVIVCTFMLTWSVMEDVIEHEQEDARARPNWTKWTGRYDDDLDG